MAFLIAWIIILLAMLSQDPGHPCVPYNGGWTYTVEGESTATSYTFRQLGPCVRYAGNQ